MGAAKAAALAGGLALAACPAVQVAMPVQSVPVKPPPQASRPAPASQPASSPAELDELLAYRLTHRGPRDRAIADAAARWSLSPYLLRGLLWHESRLDPRAEHPSTGARGVAQFTRGGAAAVARLQRLRGVRLVFSYARAFDPELAIPAAAELLRYLLDTCGGVHAALTAYNTGNCRARVPAFVRAVLGYAQAFAG